MAPSHHAAFGLVFRSAIALPELASASEPVGGADVTIERGSITARLDGGVDLEPMMQVAPGAFQLDTPAGRYRVLDGRRIIVDARDGASARDVRLYLLGTVMGALCHQRSRLALHAALLDLGSGAIALAGPSGAGKSTLAAQALRSGAAVLADDLCLVTHDAGAGPRAHRGLTRIKLWSDSLSLSGWAPETASRIADTIDKFSLPAQAQAASLPLRRVYVLRPGEASLPVFRRLPGPEAAAALISQVFRWEIAVAMGQAGTLFARCAAVAATCEIFGLAYTHDASDPIRLLDAVRRHGEEIREP